MPSHLVQQQLSVPFTYPVHFCRDLFASGNTLLRDSILQADDPVPHRCIIFLDDGLAQAHPQLQDAIAAYGVQHADALQFVREPYLVPGGEAAKNDYRLSMSMVDTLLEYRLCRHSFVIAIGGGAVLDAVGFAASIVHRGLRMIRIPSTTLAQNDAGVGVKNGMNLHGGKNTIGTFHPPFAVLNDFALLASLPQVHWIGGIAEAFKVALIKDAPFFDTLCQAADRFRSRDPKALESMILHCAHLHLQHIAENGDPFEMGRARPLDFGHWAAHKMESLTQYRLTHGEAVAIGLAIDARYAARFGWLTDTEAERLIDSLQRIGFQLSPPELLQRHGDGRLQVLDGLDDFQEHLGGELAVTYPCGLGRKHEQSQIDRAIMESVICSLADKATSC